MSSLYGLPVYTNSHLTKTFTKVKRWHRLNRPDKVRVQSRTVPDRTIYQTAAGLTMHPAILDEFLKCSPSWAITRGTS